MSSENGVSDNLLIDEESGSDDLRNKMRGNTGNGQTENGETLVKRGRPKGVKKAKRGRPPLNKPKPAQNNGENPPNRKQGRPRKTWPDEESEKSSDQDYVISSPTKRTKPQKFLDNENGNAGNSDEEFQPSVPRKRGRPRLDKSNGDFGSTKKYKTIKNYSEFDETESESSSSKTIQLLKKQVRQLKKELEEKNKSQVFMRDITNPRELVPRLCAWMYDNGWASGTGGGLTIREESQIYMAPSGVQKEQIKPSEIFVLNNEGEVESSPSGDLKLTECFPLFMNAYSFRDAGAVLHSHSKFAILASLEGDEFTIQDQEMIKGIMKGSSSEAHKNTEKLVVPIIENTQYERDLTQRMKRALFKYTDTNAVLVRNHGVYIWGKTWQKAKAQAECYHYLFEISVGIKQMNVKTST